MQAQIINDTVLLQLLRELQESGATAALFVEDGGLGNENGTINNIQEEQGRYRITLNKGNSFFLDQVMAVNGVFRTGFSTC